MGDLSGFATATLVVMVVFFGLFYVKRVVRRSLLPDKREADRRETKAELLLLQYQLQKRSEEAKQDCESGSHEGGGSGSETSGPTVPTEGFGDTPPSRDPIL